MKIKIKVIRNGKEEFLYTNLFSWTEWERLMNRRLGDGVQPGVSDWCCWAWTLLCLKGVLLPDTWQKWVAENPNMEIIPVTDETNPNPTDAATGEDSPNL